LQIADSGALWAFADWSWPAQNSELRTQNFELASGYVPVIDLSPQRIGNAGRRGIK
jgi:hypothetical protein